MLNMPEVRALLELVTVVVAVGGGGIPVVRAVDGNFEGRDAVIDKDLASVKLAEEVGVDVFLIATDESGAMVRRAPRTRMVRLVMGATASP